MKSLQNKVAVITGAASGFGPEMAIACAGEGMSLALTDIDEKNLQISASHIARIMLDAVKEGRFCILPHQKIKCAIGTRMRDILDERSPTRTAL